MFTKLVTGQLCHARLMEEWRCQDGALLRSGLRPWDSARVFRFDIFSFGFKGPEDEAGILRSRDEVTKLITQEIDGGVSPNRIVIGGFSQGGAMSLTIGLTTKHKLAGLTALSGWFPIREKVKDVSVGTLVLVIEKFDTPLIAARTACNHGSYLLGTR